MAQVVKILYLLPFSKVNTMVVDGLEMQGARASTAMILT